MSEEEIRALKELEYDDFKIFVEPFNFDYYININRELELERLDEEAWLND